MPGDCFAFSIVIGCNDDIFFVIIGNNGVHLIHVRLLVGIYHISDGIVTFDVDVFESLYCSDVTVARDALVSISEVGLDFAAFAAGFHNEEII